MSKEEKNFKLITFNKEMRAKVISGKKTQTRRVIGLDMHTLPNSEARISEKGILQFRCPPENMVWRDIFWGNDRGPKSRHNKPIKPPHQVGDYVGMSEPCRAVVNQVNQHKDYEYGEHLIEYMDTNETIKCPDELGEWWWKRWHKASSTTLSPACMPKSLARHFKEIVSVRCERTGEKWEWTYVFKKYQKKD